MTSLASLQESCSDDAVPTVARPRVAVVHDGARLHYALPLALQHADALERVYVDWFVHAGSLEEKIARAVQAVRPDLGRRLSDRRCDDLSPDRVAASSSLALRLRWAGRCTETPERKFARMSAIVARHVRRRGWGDANALMGFVRNIDPALCETAREAGLTVVVDQMIAPAIVQRAEEQRQANEWPDWLPTGEFADVNFVRALEARTWAAAHHVTCPSDYVRDSLLQADVPAHKISVIPYPIDADRYPYVDRSGRSGPLVVGFVGSVTLRKGAPTFMSVARHFQRTQARFVMVGPVAGDVARLAQRTPAVELVGAVPRGQVRHWLEQFDVFFFPSTCEGSAGAIVEAMATGLPVVTTPNSGSVVRDGIDGFVLPCGDVDQFRSRLFRLIADPEHRLQMGGAARRRASTFSLVWYSRQLKAMLTRLMGTPAGTVVS